MADHATGVDRQFSIPLRPTLAVIACLFTLPVLIGLGARWSAEARISELQAANVLLQIENDSFRDATGALSAQIASLQTAVDEIGAKATLEPDADRAIGRLPERVRARAMGGGSERALAAAPILGSAFTAPDSSFGVLKDILGLIEDRLASVRTGVEKRQALAAATPTIWPLAGWISSGFGARTDPFTGGAAFHPGLDISGTEGQPVFAAADGVVVSAAMNGDYGNLVTIDHGFGIVTRYAHLSRYGVVSGQGVRRGDTIGFVGSTGRSTSPHLHYEVLVNGKLTNPLKLLAGR